ncbi:MAG: putative zinc-binding metallopeptidase [Actinomycetota bacterium]
MRSYACPHGDQLVFFDDLACVGCGTELAYVPTADEVVAAAGRPTCANRAAIGCSFTADDDGELCVSCQLTTRRPPAADPVASAHWAAAEGAKRHLFVQCLALGWDIDGARFRFESATHGPVTTGHLDGVITVDVDEVNDVTRAQERTRLGEQYRTMLGHLRHEYGHYLWWRVVGDGPLLDGFRDAFGDERTDYADALAEHHAAGPPTAWSDNHVSEYAASHPWEDFAETVAHYLHITDTLHTAAAFGLDVGGERPPGRPSWRTIPELMSAWHPVALALNALNRSMGHPPAYPFAPAPAVIDKLAWVHALPRG